MQWAPRMLFILYLKSLGKASDCKVVLEVVLLLFGFSLASLAMDRFTVALMIKFHWPLLPFSNVRH